jgi:hypothetical protein
MNHMCFILRSLFDWLSLFICYRVNQLTASLMHCSFPVTYSAFNELSSSVASLSYCVSLVMRYIEASRSLMNASATWWLPNIAYIRGVSSSVLRPLFYHNILVSTTSIYTPSSSLITSITSSFLAPMSSSFTPINETPIKKSDHLRREQNIRDSKQRRCAAQRLKQQRI